MNIERVILRLEDMVEAIDHIFILMADKTYDDLFQDRILRAGYERFLEILSEASRHVPYEIKQDRGEIEWADIAAIGNHLRHAYHKVDVALIWKIYETGEIAVLRDAAAYFIESLRTR